MVCACFVSNSTRELFLALFVPKNVPDSMVCMVSILFGRNMATGSLKYAVSVQRKGETWSDHDEVEVLRLVVLDFVSDLYALFLISFLVRFDNI